MKYKNIIIGYGASGLFLAKHLNDPSTLVLEKNSLAGAKLKLTGNGFSNFTNLKNNEDFLKFIKNSKFFYSAISKYNPRMILDFFKDNGLLINYRENDRIFTKNGSRELIDILSSNKCSVKYNEEVLSIKDNTVTTTLSQYSAQNIIIATGGLSYKVTGSTGFIYDFAKNHELKTVAPYSVEGRIIYKKTSSLSGTSLENVVITFKKKEVSGNFLFTHTGFSGSSSLKICEYLKPNCTIHINFLPEKDEESIIKELKGFNKETLLRTFLSKYFTKAFSEYIVTDLLLKENIKIKQCMAKDIKSLTEYIFNKEYNNVNPVDIDKATVSGGGLSLKEVNPADFSLKKAKGFFVIGEALDIHGEIGGYNLSLAFIEAYNVYLSIK